MIEIVQHDYSTDEDYDSCGNTTHAILKINNIRIPLCRECLKELNDSLSEFNNTLFCHKCNYFIMSEYGWRYGGSCKKWAESDGKEISEKDAGYLYCRDCMDTCRFITNNIVYRIYEDCGGPSCHNCIYGIWKYKPISFNNECKDQLGKTIFLTESEAKEECEKIMKARKDISNKEEYI